jgi:predicted membrane chloride channel (bestrophin family)
MTHQSLPQPLQQMQEMQLLDRVKAFMDSYRGIRKYLVAPLPLPWVQLGRIFVLAYVFTLPFALLSPDLNLEGVQVIFTTFLMTYGFLGCEFLFVELDDPFAEDPNDLPLAEECRAAVEDIILSLYFADGKAAAIKLESEIPTFGDDKFYDEQVLKNQPFFRLKKVVQKVKTETDPLL